MRLHGNARLTPHGRDLMCRRVREQGWTIAEAAEAAGCSDRTCYRWLTRFDAGESMQHRSSVPHTIANRPEPPVEATTDEPRRLRWTSTPIAPPPLLPTSPRLA